MRARRRRRRDASSEALARRARAAADGGARARRRRLDAPSRTCSATTGACGSRSSTTACKRSILRRLAGAGAAVTVFPHDVDADSSPATTASCSRTAPATRSRSRGGREPCASCSAACRCSGICLGHQLLALATGRETFKLPFGHRGANHPVLERATGRVLVTSQNHGFAVAPTDGREATHVSLYDGTVEGLAFPELRARSVQFHPEAGPGPARRVADAREWVEEVRRCRGVTTSSRSA